jgi:hypothetical protein
MKHAWEIAARLYSNTGAEGWIRRNRRAPLFTVGYTSIDVHGAKAHPMGSSNVDWESAFYAAAHDSPTEARRIGDTIERVTASPALRVACPKCGEDPGDKCRSDTRRGAPRQDRPHNERFAAARNTKDQP